jgi:3-hydroxyisobutyrate dehydrogenase
MMQTGFIGLGAMGLPMARNLAASGHAVRGFDRREAAMAMLAEAGGGVAASAREAASGADMLVLMVVNAAQAEQVLFADGALEALPPGGMVALMATCPPGAVASIAARVTEAGRRFLDAPVSGGVAGAKAATLTVMAAAPVEIFRAALPVLKALGDKVFHVGQTPGQGAVVKTVNQLLCGVHIAAAAEALSLAGRIGVDLNVMLEILGGSSAASWMLRDRGPRMVQAEPEITSAVDIFVKDLGIVLDAGREAKTGLPMASLAHQFFLAASGTGSGEADDSQVIRVYHAMNGPPKLP